MKQKYSLLFVHGWGFSKDFWNILTDLLQDFSIDYIDLGYLGGEQSSDQLLQAIQEHQDSIIAIGHSLGFLYLLKKFPVKFHHYIAINSFLRFSKTDDFVSGVPVRILQRMSKGIEKDSFSVLDQFYKQCQYDQQPKNGLNNEELKKGLEWLENDDLRFKLPELIGKLTIIASDQDPVVSKGMTQDSFENYPIQWVKDKTHILPVTQPNICANIIRNVY